VVNLFLRLMLYSRLLGFSTVSPHERQAHHFHKALGFPLTSYQQNLFLDAIGAQALLDLAICSAIQPLQRDRGARKSSI